MNKESVLVDVPGNIRRKIIGSENYKGGHYHIKKQSKKRRQPNQYSRMLRALRGGF